MADKHPSGNPELIKQHKNIQHKGDEELAGTDHTRPNREPRKGKPKSTHVDTGADSENSDSGSGGGSFPGP